MLVETLMPRLSDAARLHHPEGTETYVLFRNDQGACYELNEVAFEMLRLLDGTRTLTQIAQQIGDRFEGAKDVEADLQELIGLLRTEGLLIG